MLTQGPEQKHQTTKIFMAGLTGELLAMGGLGMMMFGAVTDRHLLAGLAMAPMLLGAILAAISKVAKNHAKE